MDMEHKTKSELIQEVEELQTRLNEAEEALRAIRSGDVDAIVVSGPKGEQVYSLTSAEHPYRVIVESINEGAVTLTPDGTILYANKRIAEMLKLPLEKIISRSFYDLILEKDIKSFSQLLEKGLKKGSKERFTLISSENTYVPVYLSLNSFLIDDKPNVSMVITDLTGILEAEAFSGTILDQAAESIIVCNEHGLITRVNPAAQALCGKKLYLQPFDTVFPLTYGNGKDGNQIQAFSISTALQGQTLKNREVELCEGGRTLNLILNAGPLTSVQNKNLGCVINLTDITARKKAEKALEIDQKRFFSLLNELPGYVFLQAPDYSIRYANRYFCEIFGKPDGKPCYKITQRGRKPCENCPASQNLKTKNRTTWEWTSPDGKIYQVYNYPFTDIDGSPLTLELGIDISDRKRAEEASRISENKYQLLFESLPQRIFYKDKNLIYVSCNENLARDLHISPNEIMGKTDYDLYPKGLANAYREADTSVIESGQTEDTEEEYVKDGKKLIIRTVRTPIKDENGNVLGILGAFLDITEKITLQREAERSRHLAALGELAAGVGHEINNPITGIINCAQILFNKSKEESREKDLARRIIKEGNRIANIVHSLLSFARRDTREKKSVVSIREILYETLILTEAYLRKEGIRIKLDIPHNLPAIAVHPHLIQQVFLNVINNARYALNQKYPEANDNKTLEISGEEVTIDDRPYVKMMFYDQGIGIPARIKDKIMEPFFTTKPTGKGTGLGLNVSHNIISNYRGKITIDSKEGEFTKVTIILPAISQSHENCQKTETEK
ncbi:MAG: PAS domain-containing sensor histidine kinase [Candidatus Jettenia sp.]|uniref:histidine kinase n=2 Tax=Candidatus Jettenia TaxID=360731 RepID=I3IPM4_9BACT|nr:MAG: PAS domain-containing sensor histidine kinase [Candidatus Jettenia sp. AMX1]MBC6930411.1 PAS domain-containing sensor histidine kinase [Candidatus Jettenia sp.]GAB63669.1 two-component sensor kinase [Candidatus Jettenia caeni]MCE7882095.1 PAS domain-containing sensor histidine kinase [Candidatus Jettenia sp. AMX1]MCQ3928721.1 PAS domain-containing sensor histidine kinase [Candidatus Jettenia sp.]